MAPKARGPITLTSKDHSVVDPNYRGHPEDIAVLLEGAHTILDVLKAPSKPPTTPSTTSSASPIPLRPLKGARCIFGGRVWPFTPSQASLSRSQSLRTIRVILVINGLSAIDNQVAIFHVTIIDLPSAAKRQTQQRKLPVDIIASLSSSNDDDTKGTRSSRFPSAAEIKSRQQQLPADRASLRSSTDADTKSTIASRSPAKIKSRQQQLPPEILVQLSRTESKNKLSFFFSWGLFFSRGA